MDRSLLKITLEVIRGSTAPLRADTLFGLFSWALVDIGGDAVLRTFLDSCQSGEPGVVFSDAFPGDTLPRPDLPSLGPRTSQSSRDAMLKSAREAKRLKNLRYLPTETVLEILRGDQMKLERVNGESFSTYVSEHVSMDRRSNRALDGALYSLREIRPSASFLTVYASVTSEWRGAFGDALNHMVAQGIGGSRSIGRGRFRINSISPDTSFENVRNPNAFMSLSAFVPAQDDPTDGWYRVNLKRGAAGSRIGGSTPFKRPFLFLEAGATFRTEGAPRPVYGRLLRNILPSDPRVVQSGLAVAVPARLPAHLDHEGT